MTSVGAVFPGQGSQYVGMGRELHAAYGEVRNIFEAAGDALGEDVARLCFEGPSEALDATVNTQVAIFTMSVAAFAVLTGETGLNPVAMAGHSLGEYSALHAAGAMEFTDAVKLVRARATHQQEAVPAGVGAMAAVMGLDAAAVERICRETATEGSVVELANINSPNQNVISGHHKTVEAALEKLKEAGGRRSVILPVSIPSHCSLMKGAADRLKKDIETIVIGDCSAPVIPNCDPAQTYSTDRTIDFLTRQLYEPVRWQETIERMAAMGIRTIVEIGPKQVLSGLIRRINGDIRVLHVEDAASLAETAAHLADRT